MTEFLPLYLNVRTVVGLIGVVAWIRNCRKKGVIPAKAGIHSCHAELVSASITQGIVAWLEN